MRMRSIVHMYVAESWSTFNHRASRAPCHIYSLDQLLRLPRYIIILAYTLPFLYNQIESEVHLQPTGWYNGHRDAYQLGLGLGDCVFLFLILESGHLYNIIMTLLLVGTLIKQIKVYISPLIFISLLMPSPPLCCIKIMTLYYLFAFM